MARSRKAMTFMFLLAAVRAEGEAVERAMVENVEGLRAFLDPEGP